LGDKMLITEDFEKIKIVEYITAKKSNFPNDIVHVVAVSCEKIEPTQRSIEIKLIEVYPTSLRDDVNTVNHYEFNPINFFAAQIQEKNGKETIKFATSDFLLSHPLRGLGLGSYALSKLITWANKQSKSSCCQVQPLDLSPVDAQTEEDKEIRNAFYQNFGFHLEFKDNQNKDGLATAASLDQLNIHINTNKIAIFDFESEVNRLIREDKHCKIQLNQLHKNISRLRQERFNLKQKTIFLYIIIVLAAIYHFL